MIPTVTARSPGGQAQCALAAGTVESPGAATGIPQHAQMLIVLVADRPGACASGAQAEATSHLTGLRPVGIGPATGVFAHVSPASSAVAVEVTGGGPVCESYGAFFMGSSGYDRS
ncbi:hypothetical protein GCM10009780_34060 [Actinomadura alba]